MLVIEPGYDRLDAVKELFREYQETMGLDLCFQNFEDELASLPGRYAPPEGRLYLAYFNGVLAGCIALRKFDKTTCEMKRLYVRDSFRGKKIGMELVSLVISDALEIGYGRMVLDTYEDVMRDAVSMYRKFGFTETEPYYNNPGGGALFFEALLDR